MDQKVAYQEVKYYWLLKDNRSRCWSRRWYQFGVLSPSVRYLELFHYWCRQFQRSFIGVAHFGVLLLVCPFWCSFVAGALLLLVSFDLITFVTGMLLEHRVSQLYSEVQNRCLAFFDVLLDIFVV
ncbi:7764_t:CDS:2, partial [Dentiscutata erythropus]